MNSPVRLWADSWYHVHDTVKNRELNMKYVTPISAYLWVLQSSEADLKRSQSVSMRKLQESLRLQSALFLRDRAYFTFQRSNIFMQINMVLLGKRISQHICFLPCGLITLSCNWRCWLDAKVKIWAPGNKPIYIHEFNYMMH